MSPCVARLRVQLSQVRQAASSLERVAAAMARQSAARKSGEGRASYTVGPVDAREARHSDGGRRASLGQRFSLP